MFKVRKYRQSDLPVLRSWYLEVMGFELKKDFLPTDTTLVAVDKADRPLATLSLYPTPSRYVALVDNLIADPVHDRIERTEAVRSVVDEILKLSKSMGFEQTTFLCKGEKMATWYAREFGAQIVTGDLYSLVKEL